MQFASTPRRVFWLLALAVIAFQLTLAGAWAFVDRTPPYWDQAVFVYQAGRQLEDLRAGGPAGWYKAWTTVERVRPGLISTLAVPFMALLGIGREAALITNIVLFGLLLIITYLLGQDIGGPPAGLLSIMVICCYPLVIGLAHIMLAEILLMTVVAITLLALWRSKGFSHTPWSWVVGLCIGLGLLTKVFYPIFIVGPWLCTLAFGIRREGGTWGWPRRRQWLNFSLPLLLAAALALPWYIPNIEPMRARNIEAAVGTEAGFFGPANPLTWPNLRDYLLNFVGTGTSVAASMLLALSLVGLIIGWRARRVQPQQTGWPVLFLSSSVVLSYLLFTSLKNQDLLHISGALPPLALLTGYGLAQLFGRRWAIAAGLAAVVMIGQSLLGTFPGSLQTWRPRIPILGGTLILVYPAVPAAQTAKYALADPGPWPLREILNYVRNVGDVDAASAKKVRVGVIADSAGFDVAGLGLESYRNHLPIELIHPSAVSLTNADVLINKTGDQGAGSSQAARERLLSRLSAPNAPFRLLPRTFPLPDGSQVEVYAHASPLLAAPPKPIHASSVDFDAAARFLGLDFMQGAAMDGKQTSDITYYWESLGPTDGDYSIFVHFLDPETGKILFQDDHLLFPNVYPTSTWQPGRFLKDSRALSIPDTLAGRDVIVRLGLYRGDARLPVTSSGASPNTWSDVTSIHLQP
jgi:4-amino-4-deoxy-L-arabinose transferase-like glycosyltransferase